MVVAGGGVVIWGSVFVEGDILEVMGNIVVGTASDVDVVIVVVVVMAEMSARETMRPVIYNDL